MNLKEKAASVFATIMCGVILLGAATMLGAIVVSIILTAAGKNK